MKKTPTIKLPLRAAVLFALVTAAPALSQEKSGAASPVDPNAPSRSLSAPWHDDPAIPPQQDPKALEVLKAGLKALGGEQAILGRKTVYVKRKCVNREYPEPREGTITIWFKRPDKFRKEISYPEQKYVLVFDGRQAWSDDGKGAHLLGQLMTASMYDGIKELDLPANYLDADLTYFNISQEIPGKLAHVVKVRQHGYTRELMFDVSTNLLEVSGEYENPWGTADKMMRFDRYRPVDGILVPHRVEYWRNNEIALETEILEVKFNAPIDDSLFELPASQATPKP